MAKLLFIPVSIVSGLIASIVGRKAFEAVWGLVDGSDPPESGDRRAEMPKLVASLAVQGATFAVARGVTDQLARRSFYRATGAWPGDDEDASEADEPASA